MKHFTQKILTFVGAVSTALATFAGNGTPASPFTAQEAYEQRDALAKSEQEVFVKADFLGFGNTLAAATQQHQSGENFLVGTAQHQLVVRGTNYAPALEWADSKHNWVMRGHFVVENETYVFVAEELDGAYTAEIGQEGVGTFAAKANFTLRNPKISLVSPRIANKEREFRTSVFRADTTIAGVNNGYSAFLLTGAPGTYPVTLVSQASNIKITNTMLYAGNTNPTLKNRTFYKFVGESGRTGFVMGENNGKNLTLSKPTEVYLALAAVQVPIVKEVFKLDDMSFIPMSTQTLTTLRTILRSAATATTEVYDLNGRKVGTANELHRLPQGIYVVNGRKVMNR